MPITLLLHTLQGTAPGLCVFGAPLQTRVLSCTQTQTQNANATQTQMQTQRERNANATLPFQADAMQARRLLHKPSSDASPNATRRNEPQAQTRTHMSGGVAGVAEARWLGRAECGVRQGQCCLKPKIRYMQDSRNVAYACSLPTHQPLVFAFYIVCVCHRCVARCGVE